MKRNEAVTEVARKAIAKLLRYLEGLDFRCSNEEAPNLDAERKITTTITSRLVLVIWTAVSGRIIFPKGKKMMQLLIKARRPSGQDVTAWKLSKINQYVNKDTFPQRFRHLAEILLSLATSARFCLEHPDYMDLNTDGDKLLWVCTRGGCNTRHEVSQPLANRVRKHTPIRYWRAKQMHKV